MAGIYGSNQNQQAAQGGTQANQANDAKEAKRASFWENSGGSKPTHGLKAALEKDSDSIPMNGDTVKEFLSFVGGQCFGGKPKAEPKCEQVPPAPPECEEPPVQEPPACEEPPAPPKCEKPPEPPQCEEPPVEAPPCEEPPPPPPPEYNGGKKGHCEGDPHFTGFDGEKYDVQGDAGKVYNILSDKNLQYNGRFESWNGSPVANIIEEAGLRVGDQTVTYNAKTGQATLNGENLAEGYTSDWIKFGEGRLSVTTPEYIVELQRMEDAYLNSDVHLNTDNPFADGVNPHGIMGQTADGDGVATATAQDPAGKDPGTQQGGGVLQRVSDDGSVAISTQDDVTVHRQYEMTGLLDTTASDAKAQQFVRF